MTGRIHSFPDAAVCAEIQLDTHEQTWGVSVGHWGAAIAEYLAFLAAIGRPRTTRMLRRQQLHMLAETIGKPMLDVTDSDLIRWFGEHPAWKPETRKNYRNALRGFFAWAVQYGYLDANPAASIPVVSVPKAPPRPAPQEAYEAALATASPKVVLALRLAREAGLRRAEIARVHSKDLLRGFGDPQLVVHGKGSRERVVPITQELYEELASAGAGGWVFPSPYTDSHVTAEYLGGICSEALGPTCTLHMLRHLFATLAYRRTKDIRAVQELLGHSSLAVTERYVQCDDQAKRAAMMAAVA